MIIDSLPSAYDGVFSASYEDAKRQILTEKLHRLGIPADPAQFTSVMREDVGKVGPKGYIHGWIKVGSHVVGPSGGHGRVISKPGKGKVEVEFKDTMGGTARTRGSTQMLHENDLRRPTREESVANRKNLPPKRPDPSAGGHPAGWVHVDAPSTKDALLEHMANHHGGNPMAGRQIGSKKPSAAEVRARHDEMHAKGQLGTGHYHDLPPKSLPNAPGSGRLRGAEAAANRAYNDAISSGKTVEEATRLAAQLLPGWQGHKPRWEKF